MTALCRIRPFLTPKDYSDANSKMLYTEPHEFAKEVVIHVVFRIIDP